MDHWKIGEKQQAQSGSSFFYDRVKQLRSASDSVFPSISEEIPQTPSRGLLKGLEDWSRRKAENTIPASSEPQVPKAHAEKNAEAALGNWKRQIKEYQDLKQNYFEMKKKSETLSNPEEKSASLHALRSLESQLDRMEWNLRQGYRLTRSAVRELKTAS